MKGITVQFPEVSLGAIASQQLLQWRAKQSKEIASSSATESMVDSSQ